jgi:IS30 family transposase
MKIDVFFCHPSSPWENGTCENANGLIRNMLYEIDVFRILNQRAASRIARLGNARQR